MEENLPAVRSSILPISSFLNRFCSRMPASLIRLPGISAEPNDRFQDIPLSAP